MMRQVLILGLVFCLVSCEAVIVKPEKVNGISYVASDRPIAETHINPIIKLNANYAAIMPFAFIRNLNDPNVHYNSKRQWFGETYEGAKQYIETLQEKHIKIMLKPQIWVWHGEFTGDIKMNTEEDWKLLEKSYSKYIIDFARLANNLDVEMFCIGTELELFISERPEYWKQLIHEIKSIYKGKLTYAANWDEFKYTPFWKELDFIGIDAYFPVSFNKTPSVEDCRKGWEKHKEIIKEVSKNNNKQVLFTEYGYRSVNFTGKEPWKSGRDTGAVNLEGQTNALEGLYAEFWSEDWFAGGFLWKWYHDHESSGGESDSRFTPQNKPAENVVRSFYLRY